MVIVDPLPVTAALRKTAHSIADQYRTVPAVATERSLAVLALWTADAILAGRLAPKDASTAFVELDVALSNPPAGPELADAVEQLFFEANTLDDWGTEFSGDLA